MSLPELKLKNGVHVNGAHFYPEIVKILDVARETAPKFSDNTVWVTSANDSKHMQGSLHYVNRAFDIRIRNIIPSNKVHVRARQWVIDMQHKLGEDYDVILESDHVHCEYQPKGT